MSKALLEIIEYCNREIEKNSSRFKTDTPDTVAGYIFGIKAVKEKVVSILPLEIPQEGDYFTKLVEEFREIFPQKKLPTGKAFKSNLPDLQKKMNFFLKNYRYTKEVIFEAAKQYVEYAKAHNYMFVRTAAYFVYKQGSGSDLADWCERVKNGSSQSMEVKNTFEI